MVIWTFEYWYYISFITCTSRIVSNMAWTSCNIIMRNQINFFHSWRNFPESKKWAPLFSFWDEWLPNGCGARGMFPRFLTSIVSCRSVAFLAVIASLLQVMWKNQLQHPWLDSLAFQFSAWDHWWLLSVGNRSQYSVIPETPYGVIIPFWICIAVCVVREIYQILVSAQWRILQSCRIFWSPEFFITCYSLVSQTPSPKWLLLLSSHLPFSKFS